MLQEQRKNLPAAAEMPMEVQAVPLKTMGATWRSLWCSRGREQPWRSRKVLWIIHSPCFPVQIGGGR